MAKAMTYATPCMCMRLALPHRRTSGAAPGRRHRDGDRRHPRAQPEPAADSAGGRHRWLRRLPLGRGGRRSAGRASGSRPKRFRGIGDSRAFYPAFHMGSWQRRSTNCKPTRASGPGYACLSDTARHSTPRSTTRNWTTCWHWSGLSQVRRLSWLADSSESPITVTPHALPSTEGCASLQAGGPPEGLDQTWRRGDRRLSFRFP